MLASPPTDDQKALLIDDLHRMSVLFRDRPMSKEQLGEYCRTLCAYRGFPFSFDELRLALKLACERFEEPGEVLPKPKFIMDMINPKAS